MGPSQAGADSGYNCERGTSITIAPDVLTSYPSTARLVCIWFSSILSEEAHSLTVDGPEGEQVGRPADHIVPKAFEHLKPVDQEVGPQEVVVPELPMLTFRLEGDQIASTEAWRPVDAENHTITLTGGATFGDQTEGYTSATAAIDGWSIYRYSSDGTHHIVLTPALHQETNVPSQYIEVTLDI